MAYDGLFINAHIRTLREELIGSKIEKIYQPQPYEILFSFRGKQKHLLLFSIAPQNPRFLLSGIKPQMPEKAPIFCMFLRKHLGGALLTQIRQCGFERIVFFDFIAKNELGDDVKRSVCMEIMGKHSNFMLLEDGIVKDSLKRVHAQISVREIYGGVTYELPPILKHHPLEFLELLSDQDEFKQAENLKQAFENFAAAIRRDEFSNKSVVKFFNSYFQGFSNSSSTSIVCKAGLEKEITPSELSEKELKTLFDVFYEQMQDFYHAKKLFLYKDRYGKIREISAISLVQYETLYQEEASDHYDLAIAQFFNDSNDINIYSARKNDLEKKLNSIIQKLEKRIVNMNQDLEKYKDYENFKLYGELLFANLHMIKPDVEEVEVLNYYNNENIKISIDRRLSPSDNANQYYKKYAKAKATLAHTRENIISTREELDYLNSVKHYLSNIENYDDINSIIEELQAEKYLSIKQNKNGKKQSAKAKKFAPIKYLSSDQHEIWVGRNNIQNDILTLKKSNKEFIWLHVKDSAGSHVVIQNTFENVSEECIYEAARIAAFHSSAGGSSNVPVDFTEIKYVHKPSGAKAGMVIFTDHKTVYVTPDVDEIEKLRIKD